MASSDFGQMQCFEVSMNRPHLSTETVDDVSKTSANDVIANLEPVCQTTQSASPGADVYSYACDSLTCGMCGVSFDHLTSFLFHKSQHALAAHTFKCELCNKMMASSEMLKRHYIDHHKVAMLFNRIETEPPDQTSRVQESLKILPQSDPGMISEMHNHYETEVNNQEIVLNVTSPKNNHCPERVEHSEHNYDQLSGEVALKRMESDQQYQMNSVENLQHIESSQPDSMNSLQTNSPVIHTSNTSHNLTDAAVVKFIQPESDIVMTESDVLLKEEIHIEVQQIPTLDEMMDDQSTDTQIAEKSNEFADYLFLLITETGVKNKKPFKSHWYCCILCSNFKTRHRKGIQTHFASMHPRERAQLTDVMDPHPIEETFDLKNVSLEKEVLELRQYDHGRPVVGNSVKRKLETQDMEGHFPCEICNKLFSRVRYLRRHMTVHKRAGGVYKCDKCDAVFKSEGLLKKHDKIRHKKLLSEYQCTQCDFKSTNKVLIHNHRQIHKNDSVICDVCGLAFCDKSTLKRHMDVHDVNRPFVCSFQECNWRFKTQIMRDAHIRAHTTVGKFKCPACFKHFRHKHHLQRHQSSCHGNITNNLQTDHHQNQNSINQVGEFVEVPSNCVELQIEEDSAISGDQVFMIPGDLGSLESLINMKGVEVVVWQSGAQTE